MKKFLLTCGLVAAGFLGLDAQIIKSGNITANETWTNDNIYLLNGWVYVKAGATVTIQAGTVIKGDFASKGALIVERDAKLVAIGTADQPIVFTSQKAVGQRSYGDWGGVILCGRASVNLAANGSLGTQQGEGVVEGGVGSIYGGGPTPNDDDSSGVMKYVRIEYPGVAFQPNSEINGLTLCGVGRKTVIEHIQVSYSGDDSYEFFGGTVNCKWLIAYRGWDDDFDTDNGYGGHIQFGVAMRDPNIADQSGSNGFESDNDATGTTNTPITHPIFSNISVFGPYSFNSTINSLYKRALHLRRSTTTCTYNSVFCGYPTGLLIESTNSQTSATNGTLVFKNNVLAAMNDTLATTTNADPNNVNGPFDIGNPSGGTGWFYTNGFNNSLMPSASSLMVNNLSLTAPRLTLQASSPLLTGASFTDANLSTNPFFTPVSYRGAFDGTNDWTSCWAEWDPQNQVYNTAMNNAFSVTATASDVTTFCQGGSVDLTADAVAGASYAWSNGATTQTITVSTSGTYSCTVTKSSGCTATTNAITVVVNPLPAAPVITANGPTTFCNGGNVQLSSSYASGIMWSNNATTQAITVNASGNYTVDYTDNNGCTSSATQAVTVNPNPAAPTITANGSTSFCTGDSVQLSSSAASGNVWSTTATTQSIYVSQSGSYTVTYTDVNGCSATSSATTVSVSSSPAPTVNITGATAICPGDVTTLTASTSDSYLWSNGATTQSINVTTAGTYSVTVTNSNACNGVGTSSPVVITVNAAPTAAFNYSWNGTLVNFNNTSTGGTLYSWDFGDQNQSTGQNPSHLYGSNGTYTVTLIVTNSSGCTDTTTSTVSFFVGIADQQASNNVALFPNPTSGMTNINVNLADRSDVNIFVFDITGKKMLEQNMEMQSGKNTFAFDATDFSNGIYFVRITAGNYTQTIKMVVNKQ